MTQAPCTNRLEARGDRAHHPRNFGDALSADHEVVSDVNEARVQHLYAVVVQDPVISLDSKLPYEEQKLRGQR